MLGVIHFKRARLILVVLGIISTGCPKKDEQKSWKLLWLSSAAGTYLRTHTNMVFCSAFAESQLASHLHCLFKLMSSKQFFTINYKFFLFISNL